MCKYILPWQTEDFGDKITTPVAVFAFYFVLTKLDSQVEFYNYGITVKFISEIWQYPLFQCPTVRWQEQLR